MDWTTFPSVILAVLALIACVFAVSYTFVVVRDQRKKSLPIVDKNFWNVNKYSCSKHGSLEEETEYAWRTANGADKIVVYTDLTLWDPLRHDHTRVAWILEPEAIHPEPYRKLREMGDAHPFVAVLVSCRNSGISREVYVPNAMTHIPGKYQGLYHRKTKSVCIFASGKNGTDGHKLRNKASQIVPEPDRYGAAHNRYVKLKSDVLPAYLYCIAIENSKVAGYFSEKIIDCFLCGVVPIYWGDPEINKVFDTRGIIPYEHGMTIPDATEYAKRLPYIRRNYETALQYRDERRVFELIRNIRI